MESFYSSKSHSAFLLFTSVAYRNKQKSQIVPMHLPLSSWLKRSHDCARVDSDSSVGCALVNRYSANEEHYSAQGSVK